MRAVKNRIIEIQIEDEDNPLTDHYSSLYAVATKILHSSDVCLLLLHSHIGFIKSEHNAENLRRLCR